MLNKKIKNIITIPRSIYHYKKGNLKLPYLPNALWIEPTNICNLKCIMCPNSVNTPKNPGFMDMDLYKQIIDEGKNFASYIILCISGESLLHKNLPEMIYYAKKNKVSVYLSTNATLLTSELSKKILTAGLDWINFSFDGCTKEIYEKIRVGANFENTLQNIINFLKIKKELKAKTSADLQIIITDEIGQKNYEENIGKFSKQFEGLPLDCIQIRKPSTWGKFLTNTDKFKPKKLGGNYSACSYLWSSIHILWDGKIVACTSDFYGENILGQFPQKSLKEIWNDKPMQNFRRAMINNSYLKFNKYCENCDSLWEERILGLPPGIRGISAATVNNVFGKNLFKQIKKIVRFFNKNFSMNVIKIKK